MTAHTGRHRTGRTDAWAPAPLSAAGYAATAAALSGAILVLLALMGRPGLGAAGFALIGPSAGAGGSEAAFDAYTLQHLVAGLLLRIAIRPRTAHWPGGWLMVVAVASAGVWEIAENSPLLIDRFGSGGGEAPYTGDTLLNAGGDIVALVLGFAAAAGVPAALALVFAGAVELGFAVSGLDGFAGNLVRLATG